MTLVVAVTDRTKRLLFERKISQYRLIKETCIDKTTIQTIFKGKTKDIRLSTVRLIAEFFGMSLSEFFNDKVFGYDNLDY